MRKIPLRAFPKNPMQAEAGFSSDSASEDGSQQIWQREAAKIRENGRSAAESTVLSRDKRQIARKGCDFPRGSEMRVRRRDQSAISQPAFNKNLSKCRNLLQGYHRPSITIMNHWTNCELSVFRCSNSSFVVQRNRLLHDAPRISSRSKLYTESPYPLSSRSSMSRDHPRSQSQPRMSACC
jgi:hypothetical protein